MTVQAILPAPGAPGTRYAAQMRDRLDRLAVTDPEHKDLALAYLASHAPGVLDTILDDTEPSIGYDPGEDLEPFCHACDDPLGIFIAYSPQYQHYKGEIAPGSKPRPTKPATRQSLAGARQHQRMRPCDDAVTSRKAGAGPSGAPRPLHRSDATPGI